MFRICVINPSLKRSLASLALLATLAGCGHVPILSVPALASIDFRTTEFQALRAAVEMPDMLVPRPAGVRLNVELTIEGEVAEQRSYALVQMSSAQSAQVHGFAPETGRHAFIYRLADADQLGMESIRQAILAAEEAGQSGGLSLRVSVEDVCVSAALPEDALLVDVFLMTSETRRFVRTLDGFNLRELSDPGVSLEQSMRPCGG